MSQLVLTLQKAEPQDAKALAGAPQASSSTTAAK
jgi:hypothetical protein